MTTYCVSVTNHIPKKEGTCLHGHYDLETALVISIHTGNREPSKPQSWKRSVVSGGCQCFTPAIKSRNHEWTDAQVGHRSVCRPWRQSSVISQEIPERREKAKEREKFLNHFWSYYWLYEHSETMVKMACSEFGFELKRMQEKQRLTDEFNPCSVFFHILLLGPALPVMRTWC